MSPKLIELESWNMHIQHSQQRLTPYTICAKPCYGDSTLHAVYAKDTKIISTGHSCYVTLIHVLPHCAFQGGSMRISRVASVPTAGQDPWTSGPATPLLLLNQLVKINKCARFLSPRRNRKVHGGEVLHGGPKICDILDRPTDKQMHFAVMRSRLVAMLNNNFTM